LWGAGPGRSLEIEDGEMSTFDEVAQANMSNKYIAAFTHTEWQFL